ncbi:MAG: NAD-dependent epimerase/dehydratase family protein [Flavobacteriales bacterium]|nr:NAD-dependent epimerase/dehydratase family protein [Flavobacteriales bacterium]
MILVTGATGLVGSHLLYQICQTETKVRALKRERSDVEAVRKTFSYYTHDVDALFDRIEWVDADLMDLSALEHAFNDITQIYHCAAWVSFNPKHRYKMRRNNVLGTANIVNLCLAHGVEKLVYVSSVAALGPSENQELKNEENLWVDSPNNSHYAISKYQAELEVWRGIEEGLTAVMVNPSIILGPGNWSKGSSRIFYQIWKGLSFYTPGANGFVDVRDVADALVQLMHHKVKSERYILNAENTSFQQTFDCIAEAMGKKKPTLKISPWLSAIGWRVAKLISIFSGKAPIFTKETAEAGNKISSYNNAKIKNLLNFKFRAVKKSCFDFSDFLLKDVGEK